MLISKTDAVSIDSFQSIQLIFTRITSKNFEAVGSKWNSQYTYPDEIGAGCGTQALNNDVSNRL